MNPLVALSTLFIALVTAAGSAHALDYVSVADSSAILYDAPSTKAKKIFVVNRYLPLEQVVSLDGWIKVRDSSGSLAWIEKRALSSKRFVTVMTPLATVYQAAKEDAPVAFNADQQVALEWLESLDNGWVKVRHPDGTAGYVRATEVWGD
ncbi:MAG: SH3 domain-containing protein [Candidatus Nitrotoga sp.]